MKTKTGELFFIRKLPIALAFAASLVFAHENLARGQVHIVDPNNKYIDLAVRVDAPPAASIDYPFYVTFTVTKLPRIPFVSSVGSCDGSLVGIPRSPAQGPPPGA